MILLRRAPFLHFIAVGIAVFALHAGWQRVATSPTTDAALLYRTGLSLGFDRKAAVVRARLEEVGQFLELDTAARDVGIVDTDPIIRRHVEHLADLALHHGGTTVLPTEAEVLEYYASHADLFVDPSRVRLAQIYFSVERRGADAERDARATLERLRHERLSPSDATRWGDPFAGGLNGGAATQADLQRAFGPHFALAIDRAPAAGWAGPVRSAYGFHLVWVHERSAAKQRPLATVRNQIVHRLAREHSEGLAARRLELLRQMAARQTP